MKNQNAPAREGESADCRFAGDIGVNTTAPGLAQRPGGPDHVIAIRDAVDGPGFVVEILPPPLGVGHDRECATQTAAYGYAVGLRTTMRWPVRDLSSAAG